VVPPRSAAPRAPGGLELAVHAVVAAAGAHGVTGGEVAAATVPAVSHSTAVTTLRRLESRGLLGRRRVGRMIRYTTDADSAAVTATATAHRLHRLLAAAPDRARTLAAFITGLAPGDGPGLRAAVRVSPEQGPGATPRNR